MPIISIIVPVYNAEPFLRRCIESILAQVFTDFECILIDDGSFDNCPAICDEYAKKDSRVIVIHQKNSGVSAARNAGLDMAKGEWIGFVDSDDWCEPEMFQILYENAREYDADVSICGVRNIKECTEKSVERPQNKLLIFNGNEAILKMLSTNYFEAFSCNKLARKKFFARHNLRYNLAIKYMEDALLFYEIFKYAERVIYSSVAYYNYFCNLKSVTAQPGLTEASKTAFIALDKILSLENCKRIKKKIIARIIIFSYTLCQHYIKNNDYTNNDFYILRKKILRNMDTFLLDFSIPPKRKIICCLTLFFPHLLYLVKYKRCK